MSGAKIIVAQKAVKRFIEMVPEEANIGLTAFDRNGNFERAPLGSSRESILKAVDRITAGRSTPLGRSVRIAYKKLRIQAKKQLGYGDYNLVIITDGLATDGMRLIRSVRRILRESPVIKATKR